MSLLQSFKATGNVKQETDRLGGGGALESAIYGCKVSLAYAQASEGGAMGIFLRFKTAEGTEIRQTLYISSGRDKGCKPTFEKNGETFYLPGYLHANSLCLLTVGKEISEMATEKKVIKLYNKDTKTEVPTEVEMLTDLIGQDIYVGLIKQVVDKTVKGDDNKYVSTGETKEENDIDKLFRFSDKMTFAEISAQATEPAFFTAWSDKNTGVTRNKAKGASGTAGAPKAGGAPKPAKSLFA